MSQVRLWRLFLSMRSRFLALLLIAAVPLFAMAIIISVQYSRVVADQSRQHVELAREAAVARQEALLSDGERLLNALVLIPELREMREEPCGAVLRHVMEIPGSRYGNIGVVDAGGVVRCSARALSGGRPAIGADASAEPAVVATRTSRKFAAGIWHAARTNGAPVIPIALALPGAGRYGADAGTTGAFYGAVAATLRIDRLVLPDLHDSPARPGTETPNGSNDAFWVIADNQSALPLAGRTDGALPAPADIAALVAGPDRVMALSGQNGEPYVYALATLPGQLRLLLAERATADLHNANVVLARRLAGLCALLLAGLGAMAFGADLAISRPLKRLAAAVAVWRAGGRFEPGRLQGAPSEVAELAQSFAAATAALDSREQQLGAAARQQELLMQEIHHRVKNNLQIVASLLNLQASRIRLPEARAAFQAARDRIRALATLHRHLYAHGELHTINMRGFLGELCEQLLLGMGETPAGGRISLTIEAPELKISSDQAVPIALIVTEIVSNAVKYAFPGGRSGEVAVRLTVGPPSNGQQAATLAIDDDGVGIPGGRLETENGERPAGIGLQLVRGFARQLGATMRVTGAAGTHYRLDMLLQQHRVDPADARAAPEAGALPAANEDPAQRSAA